MGTLNSWSTGVVAALSVKKGITNFINRLKTTNA